MNDFWSQALSPVETADPRTEAGDKALSNVRSIDWSSLSHSQVNKLGRSVNLLSEDPRHLWKIFRFYTRMLRAGLTYEAVGLLREGNTRLRLRQAWLELHCTDIDEPDVYRKLDGEDGYETYMEYATALKDELERVPYYGAVVAGEIPEGEHAQVVRRLFEEYVPGANW
jgi:hypothetical protein